MHRAYGKRPPDERPARARVPERHAEPKFALIASCEDVQVNDVGHQYEQRLDGLKDRPSVAGGDGREKMVVPLKSVPRVLMLETGSTTRRKNLWQVWRLPTLKYCLFRP